AAIEFPLAKMDRRDPTGRDPSSGLDATYGALMRHQECKSAPPLRLVFRYLVLALGDDPPKTFAPSFSKREEQ
ncbi:hypothetical protein, partial [Pseudomonas sp.]|uniref:hypothetical protein n=1 Tax=Pseudomonas sp. TaxID=306 RepID=UPI0028AEBDD6